MSVAAQSTRFRGNSTVATKCCCPAKMDPEPKTRLCMRLDKASGGAKNLAKAAFSGLKGAMFSTPAQGAATALKKLNKNRVEVDGAVYEPENFVVYGAAQKLGLGCKESEYW